MKTIFCEKPDVAEKFLRLAEEQPCVSPAKPERFIKTMKNNRGAVAALTGVGLDPEGLEWKNPLVVVLGDSVSAGHFENIVFEDTMAWYDRLEARFPGEKPALMATLKEQLEVLTEKIEAGAPDILVAQFAAMATLAQIAPDIPNGQGYPSTEIVDVRAGYVDRFRGKLIDKFEETSVSIINSGISADVLTMMDKRLERDVLRYQPDLVVINATLNWFDELGTSADYKELLRKVVRRVKAGTEADIILLTPNGMLTDEDTLTKLEERIQAMREIASEEEVCLADTYAVWKKIQEEGVSWAELLSNDLNHPGPAGHEVYAITLMKLFED